MTRPQAPRLTIKCQKVGSGPIPGNPPRFPKIVRIFLPLISHERNQPINEPVDRVSLNNLAFTLLQLTLEFLPVGVKGPHWASVPGVRSHLGCGISFACNKWTDHMAQS